jgi:hypothetical protein
MASEICGPLAILSSRGKQGRKRVQRRRFHYTLVVMTDTSANIICESDIIAFWTRDRNDDVNEVQRGLLKSGVDIKVVHV